MLKRSCKAALIILSVFACEMAFGSGGGQNLGTIASNVTGTLSNVASLIGGAAYVCGIGLMIAGMIKFKAHKDNPQQTPLSTAFVLLAVGAGLVFIPSLISSAGATLFGTSPSAGNATGSGLGGTGTP